MQIETRLPRRPTKRRSGWQLHEAIYRKERRAATLRAGRAAKRSESRQCRPPPQSGGN